MVEANIENKKINEQRYFISGMHCASCEIIIEKRLLEFKGVKSVEVSNGKNQAIVEYEGEMPSIAELNKIFSQLGYKFSIEQGMLSETSSKNNFKLFSILKSLGVAILIIVGFLFLNKLGLAALINVGSKSSLLLFLAFGLLAGISSCAALVGGIVLSMSKQWLELYPDQESTWRKVQPHLIFNFGRLVSYGIFGAILGAIGSKIQFSLTFTSFLILAISVIMILLGLQMIGLKAFSKFQLTMPKLATRYIADEKNFQGRYMPFIMGALTFFLPCGFTITAQGLALVSRSPIQGTLIMLFFALGTLPTLLLIGLSSVKFSKNHELQASFMKVAGLIVIFFALFNINNQLNVLGFYNLNNAFINQNNINGSNADLPPIIDGAQVIRMTASASGYSPNYFRVVAGIPVRWEITDKGTSGCTNAVISRSLFDGEIDLTLKETSVKEFTPTKIGKYKFSCWMGMISGIIEVVDAK